MGRSRKNRKAKRKNHKKRFYAILLLQLTYTLAESLAVLKTETDWETISLRLISISTLFFIYYFEKK